MEVVLQTDADKFARFKDSLLKDETVNRASIVFKGAEEFGLGDKGYYCCVSGLDAQCKRALELAKGGAGGEKEAESGSELAKEVAGDKKEKILKKIKEEEDRAMEGFGGIFG
jgi:hypothetical protein